MDETEAATDIPLRVQSPSTVIGIPPPSLAERQGARDIRSDIDVADYLDAAKVKAKPAFDTLGRGEMLADARTGRNRRDALVGIGVPDWNQSLTATFTWHNLSPPLGRSVGMLC